MSRLRQVAAAAESRDGAGSLAGHETREARVVDVGPESAMVEGPLGCCEVPTDFVPGVRPGDRVLVHLGVAIAVLRSG